MIRFILAALAMTLTMGHAPAQPSDAAIKELAPTGKLRVAIAVSPSPSALYVVKDGAGYKGVSIDLGAEMAAKLGLGVEYMPYLASGEITNAADKNIWDVTFVPYDAERAKFIAFGPAFHLLQSTYLVAPGSAIKDVAEVNRAGVRIAGVANTATFRASSKASPNATTIIVEGVDAAVALMKDGKADAIALSRESLVGLLKEIPGSRILDGGFLNSVTASATPKGRPAALALLGTMVEDLKASGAVRRAFDKAGLVTSQVAPAGMKPE